MRQIAWYIRGPAISLFRVTRGGPQLYQGRQRRGATRGDRSKQNGRRTGGHSRSVGLTGFEPATSTSQTWRATKLRHSPSSYRPKPSSPPTAPWKPSRRSLGAPSAPGSAFTEHDHERGFYNILGFTAPTWIMLMAARSKEVGRNPSTHRSPPGQTGVQLEYGRSANSSTWRNVSPSSAGPRHVASPHCLCRTEPVGGRRTPVIQGSLRRRTVPGQPLRRRPPRPLLSTRRGFLPSPFPGPLPRPLARPPSGAAGPLLRIRPVSVPSTRRAARRGLLARFGAAVSSHESPPVSRCSFAVSASPCCWPYARRTRTESDLDGDGERAVELGFDRHYAPVSKDTSELVVEVLVKVR